jgi:hypothetical protein
MSASPQGTDLPLFPGWDPELDPRNYPLKNEWPTTGILRTKTRSTTGSPPPEKGHRAISFSKLKGLPLFLKARPNSPRWYKYTSTDAWGGIVRIPYRGGYSYQLLLTHSMEDEDPASARCILEATEKNLDVTWMKRNLRITLSWRKNASGIAIPNKVDWWLYRSWVEELFSPFELVPQEERWLISRFLPRRLPAVVQHYKLNDTLMFWLAI